MARTAACGACRHAGAGDARQPYYGASCSAGATCARAWPPVLTDGSPGLIGVPPYGIERLGIGGGLTQVTWYGRPLYLFSNEQITLLPDGKGAAKGNGNGIHAFGGTFSLVVNP
jgi:predicted lipoprotein with Yx(FWY)xxD motif